MSTPQKVRADMQIAALIGDVVDSRTATDRTALQRTVVAALAQVEHLLPAVQPLAVSVGDEFQGAYASLADAALAALHLHLHLLTADPAVDTRFGLGWGQTTVFTTGPPLSQDGPAWWDARAAIEAAARRARSPRTRSVRTWCGAPAASAAPLNAFLSSRDDVLARMSPRALRLLRATLLGSSQAEMAAAEGISQSAVSQSLARSGAYAVIAGHELLAAGAVPATTQEVT